MGITINTRGGSGIDSAIEALRRVQAAFEPTPEEMLELGEIVKQRNLDRTAHGVDAQGDEFAPYSTNGPYYYNPSPNGSDHERRRAVDDFSRRHPGSGQASPDRRTIKFESYAAFKAAIRGDRTVDLKGISPSHMLDAMDVWDSGPNQVSVGIKAGTRAARVALEHIRGFISRNLPVRRFLGVGPGDREAVLKRRMEQIKERISR